MMGKALVADNDFLMRGFVVESLRKEGFAVVEARSSDEARRLLGSQCFELVFSDLNMYAACGLGRASRCQQYNAGANHIVLTSFGTVERAIEIVKQGAYDYLIKPFSLEQVSIIVLRVRELLELRTQIDVLEEQVEQASFAGGGCATETAATSLSHPAITNLQDLERQTIIRVLHETDGRRGVMAKKLGISVRTLQNKLNQYRQEMQLQL